MGAAPSKSATRSVSNMKAARPMTLRRLRIGLLFPRAKPARKVARYASQFGPPGPNVNPGQGQDNVDEDSTTSNSRQSSTLFKMFESAATTFASIAVLGAAGYAYHLYYKSLIIRKIDKAFEPGDPVLDLAQPTPARPMPVSQDVDQDSADDWIPRLEQDYIDAIVRGDKRGRYYILVGEKGTGKSSMLLEAMRKTDGYNVSMFEAHADLEIFRVRLGKALNYEYYEDYIGSLFSVRGPRDTTALLDIERAFNKLEKVALQRREKKKHPLILIINSAHLIRNDDDGRDLLELIQQRAEQWAAANLVTTVFNADEYWVYERLKRYATRMEVVPVLDLPKDRALAALARHRARYFPHEPCALSDLEKVYESVGGRLNYLNRVAKASDMARMCASITHAEKTWFLNKCGILGEEMDDDVMDQQKYASAAMVLARALVEKEKEMETNYHPEIGHIMPQIPLHEARQIMTRADFIESYDHDNIFTIDSMAMVRADSVPMMNAFREICTQPGFDEYLEATLDRISAIESLNRTKEVTLKDLWIEQKGELRGKYEAIMKDTRGRETGKMEFSYRPPEEQKDDD